MATGPYVTNVRFCPYCGDELSPGRPHVNMAGSGHQGTGSGEFEVACRKCDYDGCVDLLADAEMPDADAWPPPPPHCPACGGMGAAARRAAGPAWLVFCSCGAATTVHIYSGVGQ